MNIRAVGRRVKLFYYGKVKGIAMADFRLDLEKGDGVGILAVEGYINNEGGEEITAACDQCIEEGIKDFVINLEQCKIVNSMGVSCLIEVIEKVKDLKGRVGFCNVAPTMAKTFKIMGLLQASSIYESEAEALVGK